MAKAKNKRVVKGSGEQDTLTPWHRVLCWTHRAGARTWWKRNHRRRERRQGKKISREGKNGGEAEA